VSAGLKEIAAAIDGSLMTLVTRAAVPEQPDARAFGAAVEKAVLSQWVELCRAWGVTALPTPGKRTIYDAGFVCDSGPVGVDFRTKDLCEGRYSDGGICAVANLLRWMVRDGATLLVTEFGYTVENGFANFAYVASALLHTLPFDVYRLANLGTGQLRLARSIRESLPEAARDRPPAEFFAFFSSLCVGHYERVRDDAIARIRAIEGFADSGFSSIALT
jgi:hypothetical protein